MVLGDRDEVVRFQLGISHRVLARPDETPPLQNPALVTGPIPNTVDPVGVCGNIHPLTLIGITSTSNVYSVAWLAPPRKWSSGLGQF